MRFRMPLLMLLFTASAFALPLAAHATGIPYFGPIVPTLASTCAANWDSLIQLINNAIAVGITIVLLFVAPLMIAYSGFLLVVNPFNPGAQGQARSMMLNVIIGVVIALAGWLAVDALLTALTSQGLTNWTSNMFNSGLVPCLPIQIDTLNQSAGQTVTGGTIGVGSASGVPLSASGSGACDPTVVASAAQASGNTISNSQALLLACLARPESVCGTAKQNYNWNGVQDPAHPSTAYGAFQVTLSGNSACYENATCQAAAGTPGVALNCSQGFKGGKPIPGSVIEQNCERAAADFNCNTAAAVCVLKSQGATAWTGDAHGASDQKSCVSQYGNG